jgi:hypothetical protein
MATDYLLISKNPNYRFILAGLQGGGVEGVIVNDISINLGNDFSSTRDAITNAANSLPFGAGELAGKAFDIKDAVGNVASLSGRSRLTQFETRKVWDGSRIPQFQIEFFFLHTSVNEADSAIDKIKRLQSAVLPTGVVSGAFFRAPLGYKLNGSGLLTLDIGRWFVVPRVVMTDISFSFTKEVMSDGRPLGITGTFTVEPYQAITYDEFMGYYRI